MNPLGYAIFAAIFFGVGTIIGGVVDTNTMKNKAIKYNCAQYNSQTGNFEWLKK
jgi:hypothetical protein